MITTTKLAAAMCALALTAATGCTNDSADGETVGSTTTAVSTTAGSASGSSGDGPGADNIYSDPAKWLCAPGADDACSIELSVSTVNANGVKRTDLRRNEQPFDCFYVYPTISRDATTTSDWFASEDEEGYVARYQAAPLTSRCRVFAPLYRQWTLASIGARVGGDVPDDEVNPYDDVLAAWRHYLATDNDGRGVVLIGHSQGSMHLTRLIQEEIEPDESASRLLIAAYLAGTSIQVPDGADVGATFSSTPLCREETDTGCVVTWSSYRSEEPESAGSIFGRHFDGTVAACNPPSSLRGTRSVTSPLMPAVRNASILSSLLPAVPEDASWFDGAVIDTTYVALDDFVFAECRDTETKNAAMITVHADPTDPRADDITGDLSAEWGLHLVDVSLFLGDIIDLISTQFEAWESAPSASG